MTSPIRFNRQAGAASSPSTIESKPDSPAASSTTNKSQIQSLGDGISDTFARARKFGAEYLDGVQVPNIMPPSSRPNDGYFIGASTDPSGAVEPQLFSPDTPLDQIPPVQPADGQAVGPTTIYVNGIGVPDDQQAMQQLQGYANSTHHPTIGVFVQGEPTPAGMAGDTIHAGLDTINVGDEQSEKTLASLVLSKVTAEPPQPVRIAGYSRGALVTSRALQMVAGQLRDQGMSEADIEKRLSVVQVETFGGAAHSFPDGPQYVHYINDVDPVATNLGVWRDSSFGPSLLNAVMPSGSPHPGKDAQIRIFHEGDAADVQHYVSINHGIGTYLNHRVEFDEARSQGNVDERQPAPADGSGSN